MNQGGSCEVQKLPGWRGDEKRNRELASTIKRDERIGTSKQAMHIKSDIPERAIRGSKYRKPRSSEREARFLFFLLCSCGFRFTR